MCAMIGSGGALVYRQRRCSSVVPAWPALPLHWPDCVASLQPLAAASHACLMLPQHPILSFLTVADGRTSTKQAAPVHSTCSSRLLAVCSPASLRGLTVGAACMKDTPVLGGPLRALSRWSMRVQGWSKILEQTHTVDCVRGLLSAVESSAWTVNVSAAGAPWHLLQSWAAHSLCPAGPVRAAVVSPDCQQNQSPERCCLRLCRSLQRACPRGMCALPRGTSAARHPGQSQAAPPPPDAGTARASAASALWHRPPRPASPAGPAPARGQGWTAASGARACS